ncbi:MAG TPA: hypothetical protein DCZ69_14035 [Syntrophobacteraceae bacterium]|nr:hypothetical protein [Syntrophobacteraceae bacterium]HBD09372.1 hypothetical protein [Syntrophobacteraceae bacterium]HBZ55627.1 hypothetical protein [Syntrophobacteraceae bacterium]
MLNRKQGIAVACSIGLLMVLGQIEGVVRAEKHLLLAQETSANKPNSSGGGSKVQAELAAPTYADVATIFSKYNCTVCHGESEPRAGLSLVDYKSVVRGGKHGSVIKAGDPDKSELVRRLKGTSEPRMPYTGPPWLSEDEVALIERWISSGAPEAK